MKIGIGLPNTLNMPGPAIVDWSRRAEERGFAMLGTIDRIVYPTYDSLTILAVAAGATERIGLFTDILLTPLYPPVWLAKATASLDALSGGRLALGLGVGGRGDDYEAMKRPMNRRGALMDETLELLKRAWAGEAVAGGEFPVGPPPANGNRVPILIGGTADAVIRRVVTYGDGWTSGGGGPQAIPAMAERIRAAWQDAGREGEPRIAALAYFGLGDAEASRATLHKYYGFLGEWAERISESALRAPDTIAGAAKAYEDAGVTDVVFMPTVPDVDEVNRLADAVF